MRISFFTSLLSLAVFVQATPVPQRNAPGLLGSLAGALPLGALTGALGGLTGGSGNGVGGSSVSSNNGVSSNIGLGGLTGTLGSLGVLTSGFGVGGKGTPGTQQG